jgi:hypothetical protein
VTAAAAAQVALPRLDIKINKGAVTSKEDWSELVEYSLSDAAGEVLSSGKTAGQGAWEFHLDVG